jgi:predicted DCC family thiol-disulfide oxidoreductase YuxK
MQETDKHELEVNSAEIEADQSRTTVYYDGSCPLCSVEIGHYASCAGADRLMFVDVSDPNAGLGDDLTRQNALERFHVRRPDGVLLSGARGFTELWGTLPKWRWLARVARLPGVISLLELAYRGFLPIRPALSWIASRLGAKPVNRTDTST